MKKIQIIIKDLENGTECVNQTTDAFFCVCENDDKIKSMFYANCNEQILLNVLFQAYKDILKYIKKLSDEAKLAFISVL